MSFTGGLQSAEAGAIFESACRLRSLAGAGGTECSAGISFAPEVWGNTTKQFTPSHCGTGGGAALATKTERPKQAQKNTAFAESMVCTVAIGIIVRFLGGSSHTWRCRFSASFCSAHTFEQFNSLAPSLCDEGSLGLPSTAPRRLAAAYTSMAWACHTRDGLRHGRRAVFRAPLTCVRYSGGWVVCDTAVLYPRVPSRKLADNL